MLRFVYWNAVLLLCSYCNQWMVGVNGFPLTFPRSDALSNRRSQELVSHNDLGTPRRDFLTIAIGAATAYLYPIPAIAVASSSLDGMVSELRIARQQMNDVPSLIQKEQWDAVRSILVTPPVSDLWTKSARKTPFLQEYANVIGGIPSGDELAVLEAKEDVEGHLRFLDMAAYNNVFNPIKSMGETGATKELIRSYYNDPINEYKASITALDELIQLGNVK
jgi:hypothetical protein